MKKTIKTKKLSLNKETIRNLTDSDMGKVQGGIGTIACGLSRGVCPSARCQSAAKNAC